MKSTNEIIYMVISVLINFAVLPLSFLIGVFVTDAGGGFLSFLMGFMFFQFIPLAMLVISIILFIRKKRTIKIYKENEERGEKESLYHRIEA